MDFKFGEINVGLVVFAGSYVAVQVVCGLLILEGDCEIELVGSLAPDVSCG